MPIAKAPASVLVVEHHEELRAALRDWLVGCFHPARLWEASTLEEALRQQAGQATLDLALVNVELPGRSGIEAARELKRQFPYCPVVVMSLNDSEALRLAALDAGADAFICKRELPGRLLPVLTWLAKDHE